MIYMMFYMMIYHHCHSGSPSSPGETDWRTPPLCKGWCEKGDDDDDDDDGDNGDDDGGDDDV